jgi:serine/threonine protein kinase
MNKNTIAHMIRNPDALYHRKNKEGHVGFKIAGPNATNASRLNLTNLLPTAVHRGMAKLDAGAQGAVFIASMDKSASPETTFVIKVCPLNKKQPAEREYAIQEKLWAIAPEHIPRPLGIFKTTNFVDPTMIMANGKANKKLDYDHQTVMCFEYVPNGPLTGYLNKVRSRLSDRVMHSIIRQVLETLAKIQLRLPEFRHNDLHMKNVLVKKGLVVVLNDFGWSRLSRANAQQSKTTQMNYGIGPDTNVRYDHHLFLSELRNWVQENGKYAPDGLSRTLAFLNRSIPEAYRHRGGYPGNMTRENRLIYGLKHESLPSLRLIMKDPYIGAPKAAPATLTVLPTMKPKAPVSIKVYTNENLVKLTAANFMKLTAAQRARLMELKGAKTTKKATVMVIPKKPSPKKTPASPNGQWGVHISPRHLRGAKFNRLVAKFEIVNHDRNVARAKAQNVLTRRIMMGRSPFSPSPVKSKKKTPSPPRAKTPARPRTMLGMVRSPGGRLKLKGMMGRLVYASGMSLEDLRDIAGVFKIDTKTLKTKAKIAEALFSK